MGISFEGRVAIVTGAGTGLGRAHALGLAARGAKVVVNDLGTATDGSGHSSSAADAVVAEITAAGGEATSHGADVTDPGQVQDMVDAALGRWGRVDILVANAGILRDRSFAKMTLDDFRKVLDVHVMGSVVPAKALWEVFRQQGYGRIAFTTSASGLYGNFGQANYGAAKMALVGLMNVLAQEGAKYDIRVNCLAPTAATRMTEGLIPEESYALLTPEAVTPGLLALVSDAAPSGLILGAGAGVFAETRIEETTGAVLAGDALSPEGVMAQMARIRDDAGAAPIDSAFAQTRKYLGLVAEQSGEEALWTA